jgi:hypothetical protein
MLADYLLAFSWVSLADLLYADTVFTGVKHPLRRCLLAKMCRHV